LRIRAIAAAGSGLALVGRILAVVCVARAAAVVTLPTAAAAASSSGHKPCWHIPCVQVRLQSRQLIS
jgi:hypothetical protein